MGAKQTITKTTTVVKRTRTKTKVNKQQSSNNTGQKRCPNCGRYV